MGGGEAINEEWMEQLFPLKDTAKRRQWLQELTLNEFESRSELKSLTAEDWNVLQLPLAVKRTLRDSLADDQTSIVHNLPAPPPLAESLPLTQLDCIVIDVSGSMRARSSLDVDKTREDVSKLLFHTAVDRLISLEMNHAVGLLSFGETVSPVGITTEYERFHDELGRLDANQHRTKLFDAIFEAAKLLEDYHDTHVAARQDLADFPVKKRIFVLTDGEDNASGHAAWQVAQFLQQRNIVLDAVPVAGHNSTLQAMCAATSGLCFSSGEEQQGASAARHPFAAVMRLFEREATLHLAHREEPAAPPPRIADLASLDALTQTMRSCAPVTDVASAPDKRVFAKVMTAAELSAMATEVATKSSAAPESAPAASLAGGAAVKRVLKEYAELEKQEALAQGSGGTGIRAFVNASDCRSWKVVLSGLGKPYDGGAWLLTVSFPCNYPFSPPSVRFVTPIFHPNVSADGRICLDILKSSWSPALNAWKVLQALRGLLIEPNADDPLDVYKGQLYSDDRDEYMKEVVAHTKQHASEGFNALAAKYNLE